MSSASVSGAGVDVPGGDAGALQGAADYHYQLAYGLEYHAGTMDATATALYHVWSGQAAGSYQALSSEVVAHYRSAAGTARDIADALHRYASELRQYQQEGQQALHQAVYWLDQVRQWGQRYTKAKAEVTTAQRAVQTAQSQLNTASAIGPGGDGAAGAAQAALTLAQGQLQRAQDEVRICQEELQNAEHQLLGWQRRGHQIWEEAQQAADRATGTLDATCVAPPPLASAVPAGASASGSGALQTAETVAGDLASAALAFTSGRLGRIAKEAGMSLKDLREFWLGQRTIGELLASAEDPAVAEQALKAWARAASRVSNLSSKIGDLGQVEHAAGWMGPVGGVLDAGLNLAEGHGVTTSVEKGAASGALGTFGTWVGGVACAATPGLEEAAPLCAGAVGALGGLFGDLLG